LETNKEAGVKIGTGELSGPVFVSLHQDVGQPYVKFTYSGTTVTDLRDACHL
jgi:hypothetical protein